MRRRTTEGMSKAEVIRCLKRYVAREVFSTLRNSTLPKALLDIYRSIRLVTELRLAGATTIEEANAVLKEFLDRFNARFGVAARHPETAYRPLGPGACLDTVLCFRHSRKVARDNTVKYRWRTLQLLPGTERRSYAGAVVDDFAQFAGAKKCDKLEVHSMTIASRNARGANRLRSTALIR